MNPIRKIRIRLGISKDEFAEKMNTNEAMVTKYERGSSFPDLLTLIQISDFSGVCINDLISTEHRKHLLQIRRAVSDRCGHLRHNKPGKGLKGLLRIRRERRLSRAEAAKKIGISPFTVRRYEILPLEKLNPKMIRRIAKALNVTVKELK